LHAVTTGYQLQQPFEGGYAYLSGHIQPDVVVVILTAGLLHDFSSFDFRRALSEAKVHVMSSVVCTVYFELCSPGSVVVVVVVVAVAVVVGVVVVVVVVVVR
jgi:hypothetical protein